MADVFISYSRKDSEQVKRLINSLKSHGISYWIDYENIPHGVPYDDCIRNAIPQSSIFLLVVSEDSMRKPDVKNELRIANKCGKLVIPFMLEDVELIDAVSYHIEANNRINAFEDWDIAINGLLNDVRRSSQQIADTTGNRVEDTYVDLEESEEHKLYGAVNMPITQYTGKTLDEMLSVARDDVDDYLLFRTIQQAQENPNAQRIVAEAYLSSKGVRRSPENAEKAIYWLAKAINQGDAEAMYYLGNCYYNGHGIKRNYAYAAYWYEQSATQQIPCVDAIYALADCYYENKGVPNNLLKKAEWYSKAKECEKQSGINDDIWYTSQYVNLFYGKRDEKKILTSNGYSLDRDNRRESRCIKEKKRDKLARALIVCGIIMIVALLICSLTATALMSEGAISEESMTAWQQSICLPLLLASSGVVTLGLMFRLKFYTFTGWFGHFIVKLGYIFVPSATIIEVLHEIMLPLNSNVFVSICLAFISLFLTLILLEDPGKQRIKKRKHTKEYNNRIFSKFKHTERK